MVCRSITFYGVDTLVIADGHTNSERCIHVDVSDLWVLIAKHFFDRPCLFQEENVPCHKSRV